MFKNIKLNESFAQHLIDQGIIDEETAMKARTQQMDNAKPIGRLALESKYLTMKQINHVLSEQIDSDFLFGKLAIKMGYLDENQLEDLLEQQRALCPGICDVLSQLGFVEKAVLDGERLAFLACVEDVLV